MTTGEKIKRIRRHRQMTQKELGEKIGLGAGGANRIAQYEMGYRIPKKPLLEKMARSDECVCDGLVGRRERCGRRYDGTVVLAG